MITEVTESQIQKYREDGFLIVDNFLDAEELELIRAGCERNLAGNRDMVLHPDDGNWREGERGSETQHRLIVGLWKGDATLGKHIFSGSYGSVFAQLEGLDSVRLWTDHFNMKPEGGEPLEMHQDGAYMCWQDPVGTFSCWVALDDTYEDGGTLVYVRGSHLWGARPPADTFFKASYVGEGGAGRDKWTEYFEQIAPEGTDIELVPVVVKAGGAAFHGCWTWHGSGPNTRPGNVRRSYVVEMMRGDAKHHPRIRHPVTSRFVLPGETDLGEDFFPILWSATGYQTEWIRRYGEIAAVNSFSPEAMDLYERERGPIDPTPWAKGEVHA